MKLDVGNVVALIVLVACAAILFYVRGPEGIAAFAAVVLFSASLWWLPVSWVSHFVYAMLTAMGSMFITAVATPIRGYFDGLNMQLALAFGCMAGIAVQGLVIRPPAEDEAKKSEAPQIPSWQWLLGVAALTIAAGIAIGATSGMLMLTGRRTMNNLLQMDDGPLSRGVLFGAIGFFVALAYIVVALRREDPGRGS